MEILNRNVASLPQFSDKIFGRPLADFKNEQDFQGKEILDSLRWLSFADCILLTMPVLRCEQVKDLTTEERASAEKRAELEAGLFLFVVTRLLFEMFSSGLPLRGAVDVAEFYVAPPFFAGASITKVYELATKQEWTGCVLTELAATRVEKAKTNEGDLLEWRLDKHQDFLGLFFQ